MANTNTVITNTDSQLHVDYQSKNLLRGNNEFSNGDVTASGSDVTITQGEVMGRISATGKLIPLAHGASDGSQYPAGLAYLGINQTKTITDGTTKTIELVYQGRVDASLINFGTASTLDDVVGGRTVRDWLRDIGLVLIDPQELTKFANS